MRRTLGRLLWIVGVWFLVALWQLYGVVGAERLTMFYVYALGTIALIAGFAEPSTASAALIASTPRWLVTLDFLSDLALVGVLAWTGDVRSATLWFLGVLGTVAYREKAKRQRAPAEVK